MSSRKGVKPYLLPDCCSVYYYRMSVLQTLNQYLQKKTFRNLCAGLRTERYVYPYKYIPVGRWGSGKALVSRNLAKLGHNFLGLWVKIYFGFNCGFVVHARSPNLQAYTRVSVQYHGYCTSGRGISTSQRQVKMHYHNGIVSLVTQSTVMPEIIL